MTRLFVADRSERNLGIVVLWSGFHHGAGYSVTVSKGFFIEPAIGEIPAEHYNGDPTYRVGCKSDRRPDCLPNPSAGPQNHSPLSS